MQTGATLQAADGAIILKGNLAGLAGNFDGIDVTSATVDDDGGGKHRAAGERFERRDDGQPSSA